MLRIMSAAQRNGWMAEQKILAAIRIAATFAPNPAVVQLTPTRLLLGVISTDEALVRAALKVSGASFEDLQWNLRQRLISEPPVLADSTHIELLTRGLKLTLPAATRRVLESAEAEARTLEHYDLEPGHVLLVWARDPTLEGHCELLTAGADTDRLASALTQRLPGVEPTFRPRIEASLRLPPLSDAEVQALIARVRQTPPREHADAFETLLERHLFLAWEPAVKAASRGHRLEYCCSIGTNAVLGACLNADKADRTFATWVRAHVERSLEINLKNV